MRPFVLLATLMFLVPWSALAAEQKEESARLQLTVLAAEKQQPVPNAHVVIRFVDGKKFFFKTKRTSWEAKTNGKGQLVLAGIPKGSVKIQVIAKGFQTYGEEHALSQADEELTILLQVPQGQVSAY